MHFLPTLMITTATLGSVLLAPPAVGQSIQPAPGTPAARLMAATDEATISFAGKVVMAGPDSFMLDLGRETVTVEMDDWDWFKEGNVLLRGDQVVVTGRVDQDLWEKKKIEASTVHVPKLGTTFHASGADEEDLAAALILVNPVSSTVGTVTAVEGPEFTVGSPKGPVRVDMSRIKVRPVLKMGDHVHAWGNLDVDPKEKVELMATGVAVLSRDRTKTTSS